MLKNKHIYSEDLSGKTICGKPVPEFLQEAETFHGCRNPGILLGGMMVDLALELLTSRQNIVAVSETKWSLPDAIQLLTRCTIGNGRLIVLNWGKMGLSVFSRKNLAGYRIWLDIAKTKHISSIYNWYMRLIRLDAKETDHLLTDILTAGRTVFSWRAIPMTRQFHTPPNPAMTICSQCDEAYPENHGHLCISCQGRSYYELPNNTLCR